VLLAPTTTIVTVKGLEIDGASVKWSFAGDNVDVGFGGAELNALAQGFVVCDPMNPVTISKRFEAQVVCLDLVKPLLKGNPLAFHLQSGVFDAHLSKLISTVSASGEVSGKKPRCLVANMTANVQIKTEKSLCVEPYALNKALGRFTLREGVHTVALGIITKVK